MAEFFDTHAHLDYPEYEKDFSEVIARAQTAGIVKMISIGTSLASSVRAVQLAEKFPAIYAAVGWHPSQSLPSAAAAAPPACPKNCRRFPRPRPATRAGRWPHPPICARPCANSPGIRKSWASGETGGGIVCGPNSQQKQQDKHSPRVD